MSGYAFQHEDKVYTPDGRQEIANVEEHNRGTEQAELAWLHTGPDRVFLYVKMPEWARTQRAGLIGCTPVEPTDKGWPSITTWLGTPVATHVWLGPSAPVGGIAGSYARRRAVRCRIFGVRYVGWYYETAGSYCRLRKAKRQ